MALLVRELLIRGAACREANAAKGSLRRSKLLEAVFAQCPPRDAQLAIFRGSFRVGPALAGVRQTLFGQDACGMEPRQNRNADSASGYILLHLKTTIELDS